jgi:regulatory protein
MPTSLRQKALDLLSRREHTRAELAQKLKGHEEASSAEIQTLLDTLETQTLLSDERFAEAYCTMRFKKGYGPIRISQELSARGLSDEIVSLTLDQISEDMWLEKAASVYQKKFGRSLPKDHKEKFKQSQFLYYRGFESDQIKALFRKS